MLSQEEYMPAGLLLFDPSATYTPLLTEAMQSENVILQIRSAVDVNDFEKALVGARWDAVLVVYAVAAEVLKIAETINPITPVILICETQGEAESAYQLSSAVLSDVVTRDQLKRLGFILRREMRRTAIKCGKDVASVTEQKSDAENIRRLNRTLTVLSDINQAIVRQRDINLLFAEACKIAVEKGDFRMAWIGLLDPKTRQVRPVAQAGVIDDYLENLNISLDDDIRGRGPTGTALRTKQHVVVNDVQNDALMQPWRDNALWLGYNSTTCLPLIIKGEARGVLAFYHREVGFFDDAELRLLDEMAGDISFAMEFAEQEAQSKLAQVALQRYAKRMEILHEIDTGIINATSIQSVVETALKHIRQLIQSQRVSIILLDETTNEWLIFVADADANTPLASGSRIHNLSSPENFSTGQIVVTDDMRLLSDLAPAMRQLINEGLVSALHAHFVIDNQSLGSLNFFADTPGYFTAEHQEIARQVASQVAIAIRQMRLSNEIHQSESQYRLLAENMADVVWILDADTSRFTYASPSVQQLRGYSPREVMTQTLAETLTPASLEIIADGLPKRVEAFVAGDPAATSQTHEVEQIRKDGSTVWTEVVTTLLQDASGVIRVLGVTRDITERRQAEAELREREEWIRLSMEASGLGKWRYDIKAGIIRFDKRASGHYGIDGDKATVDELLARIHPEDVERFKREMASTLDPSEQTKSAMEYRILGVDGSIRWLSALAHIYFEGRGTERHAIYGFGTSQDITERKQAEDLLQKTEARQRAMLTAIPDIMFRYRADGTFLEYHAPDSDLLAAPPEVFLGHNARDILPSTLAEPLLEHIQEVIATKAPIQMEYELAVASGIREFESRLVPLGDDEVLAIVRDVTERKLAERELQSLYNATSYLFKADSLLALGRQIVATVVREFEHADCGLMLLDKSKNNILRLARTGPSDIRPNNPLSLNGRGLVPLAMRTGEVVYVPDVSQNSDYISSDTTTQSEFVVPLKTANGIIGALDMQHVQKDAFSQRDRRILAAYAERAAPAIEIMQLYEELNRHAADLEWRVAQRTVELNYAKERAEAILNHSADGIILLTSEMHIEQTNSAFNEIFASQDDAYFEQPFIELIDDEEKERIDQILRKGNIDKKGQRLETRARRKDGTVFDAELGIGFIKKKGCVCIIRDITERKKAEELLRTVLNILPVGVWILDQSGTITFGNPAAQQIWAGAQYVGVEDYGVFKAWWPDTGKLLTAHEWGAARAIATGEISLDEEVEIESFDHTRKTILNSAVPLRDDEEKIVGAVVLNQDITERKKVELTLRESETRFRSLFASAPIATVITNQKGEITLINEQAENIFGYSARELIGQPVEILVPAAARSQHPERRAAYMAEPRVRRMSALKELNALRKDGTEFPVEIELSYVQTQDGLLVMSFVSDITERKKAEQALRESELRFGLLVNGVRDYAIYLIDTKGSIITWNQGAERIIGYNAQEITGDNIARFYTQEAVTRGEPQHILEVAATEGHYITEGERVRKDGSLFWAEVAVTALKDSSGRLFGYAKVTHDLTERRKAQETLRLNEERYRLLAENITDIISRVTPEGIYIDVSPSSKVVLGYAPEELIGKDGSDFVHPDDKAAFLQKRKVALSRRNESPLTYRFRHQDGHYIWLEVARKFIIDRETNAIKEYVTSARDITIRKRAEEALKNALEKEKELGELKSRFVSMASHEFRTPLATILATAETLSAYRSKLSENQIKDKLNKIGDQVNYLRSIIEGTLQVARLQDPKAKIEPVSLDLDAVCRSAIDEFEGRIDVTQRFVYTCDSALQEVWLDRKLIRQMLSNLLSNAVKYSASNTTITVTLEYSDEVVILKVQDEGIGIPEADLKHLFEPFHRAINVGTTPGTGLGLVIAKEAVELHGGLMTVDSKVGVGTTFTIMIPFGGTGGSQHDENSAD